MIRSEDIKRYLKCSILYLNDSSKVKKAFPLTQNYLNYRKIKKQVSKHIVADSSLIYQQFEVDIPLLQRKNNKWYLFLPVYKFSEIFYYKHDIEFMYYVCVKLGYMINKIYAVVVNQDLNKPLFEIKRVNLKETLKLDEKFVIQYEKLVQNIDDIEKPVFRKACLENGKCNCINDCFNLKDNSIMHYRGLNIEEKLQKDIHDTINESMTPIDQYTFSQINASEKGIYYNLEEIHSFLAKIQFPITYLDFEWDTSLNHHSRKREDQIFSYAMVIENHQTEKITYFDFNELSIIENLLRKIPKTGSVIVYNALGGEFLQLKRLAKKYPVYQVEIESIMERIIDLEYIFSKGYYYDQRFMGKNALKNIMKILPIEQDFEYLDAISTVEAFRSLNNKYDDKIIDEILKYNYNDVYALYLIMKILKNLK